MEEKSKFIKSSAVWSFSTLFLSIFSMLSFIPIVVIVSDAEGLSQKIFQYLIVVGVCASMTVSFVELYMEGKYRKNGKSSAVCFWRKLTLFHWLVFVSLLYVVFSDINPIVIKGYI